MLKKKKKQADKVYIGLVHTWPHSFALNAMSTFAIHKQLILLL